MKKNKIVFIYQNAFSQTGGIQTFNKYFISALEEINTENDNISVKLVSIYDKKGGIESSLPYLTLNSRKIAALRYIILNAKNYDTYIFAHVNLSPLAIILNLLNPKARIIFCTHGIEVWKKLPKYTEWIMNHSTVLTVSNFSKNKLEKYNSNLKNISLFPNCIKVKELKENRENPFNSNNYNVLSVTRLSSSEKLKGIDTVIKTIALLKDTIPNIKYSIVGRGEDVKRLQKITNDLNVSAYVDFLGFVNDVNAYYQHCDLFALPSKKEGFGIVYLEAMQYKKPVIAVNYGGVTDVIIDGETGFLCEYEDVTCLAKKILKLNKDMKLSLKMGQNGFDRLNDNFRFHHFKNRLENILI